TATSTDGAADPSAASSPATVAITVAPVSDTPSVAASVASVSLNENTSTSITGVSVTPATGDEDDPVAVTLNVGHGTLHLGTAPVGVTVTNNDSGVVTVSGAYGAVNTLLGGLQYTATSEYEGSDTLTVTATSTDGAADPSAASSPA